MKPSLDLSCDVAADRPSADCRNYARYVDELFALRESIEQKSNHYEILLRNAITDKSSAQAGLAQTLQGIKLQESKGVPVKTSPELTAALEEAKAATHYYGATSAEARLAWESYEEVAARGAQKGGNAMATRTSRTDDPNASSGQSYALEALNELDRVMGILVALSERG